MSGRCRAIMSSLIAEMLFPVASGAWTWVTPQTIFLGMLFHSSQKTSQNIFGDAAAIFGRGTYVIDGFDVEAYRLGESAPLSGERKGGPTKKPFGMPQSNYSRCHTARGNSHV